MLVPYALSGIRRTWFVPGLRVWGSPSSFTIDFLVAEQPESSAVCYGTGHVGDLAQIITWAELVDSRGNHLPDTLDAPRVIVRPRSGDAAFVVGQEDERSFKIARAADSTEAVTVDLLVLEMGQ